MTKPQPNNSDSTKADRTRRMLLDVFMDLVLVSRQEKIRVQDVIRSADVGRSTFYDHYSGIDEIHREALKHPMGRLADVLVGVQGKEQLIALLDHFWEYRSQARETIASAKTRDAVVGVLHEQLVERVPAVDESLELQLQSRQLAESTMALIRVWITGEVECSVSALGDCICSTAGLFLKGLDVTASEGS